VVSFVAKSGTGKTTFLKQLIPKLVARGLRVGKLKHHSHPTPFDVSGKDTYRVAQSGAKVVVGACSVQVVVFRQPDGSANLEAIIAQYPKLFTGVTLNKREGRWYATLVVEKPGQKAQAKKDVTGIDIGMAAIGTTSTGEQYGQVSDQLAQRVEKKAARFARKQKLNTCLKRNGLPPVSLTDHKAEAFVRNEIGRALNELVDRLPADSPVAVERLLEQRFQQRLSPDACSASARLDTLRKGNAECPQQSISPVQPHVIVVYEQGTIGPARAGVGGRRQQPVPTG